MKPVKAHLRRVKHQADHPTAYHYARALLRASEHTGERPALVSTALYGSGQELAHMPLKCRALAFHALIGLFPAADDATVARTLGMSVTPSRTAWHLPAQVREVREAI